MFTATPRCQENKAAKRLPRPTGPQFCVADPGLPGEECRPQIQSRPLRAYDHHITETAPKSASRVIGVGALAPWGDGLQPPLPAVLVFAR